MTTPSTRFIPVQPDLAVRLSGGGADRQFHHLFEKGHIHALNTAIACGRPLLLTGEPGVGKTQLARAAAKALGRAFVRFTVDSRSESRDLLWRFDPVARLAEAQVAGSREWSEGGLEEHLEPRRYLRPGPLWWGFDWDSAAGLPLAEKPRQRDEGNPENGVVVLIDEIDKAEVDVPNGLLEALGEGSFQPEGWGGRVRVGAVAPLVVITSNRERSLPDAFVRRCVVLRLTLPEEADELKGLLRARGKAHTDLDDGVLETAAGFLVKDRSAARAAGHHPLPGQAEYLDLLRAVEELSAAAGEAPDELLERVRPFILRKGEAV
ncbi:AAA family ATPase [Endothiovibrio diazotrophicus]